MRDRIAGAVGCAANRMELDPESALQADQNTLEWSIRHRGPESTMTLNAKSQVAVRLEQLGRFDEALQLRSDVTNHLRIHMGTEDLSTLTVEGLQAFDFDRLGRHGEALPLFEHVVAGRTDELGPDHQLTLLAMDWLGCTHRSLGNLPEACRLFEEAVVRYEESGCGETEDCMMTTAHLATTSNSTSFRKPASCVDTFWMFEVERLVPMIQ